MAVQNDTHDTATPGDPHAEQRVRDAQRRMTQATQEAADLRRQMAALAQENQQLRQQLEQRHQQAAPDEDIDLSDLDEALENFDDATPIMASKIKALAAQQKARDERERQREQEAMQARYAAEQQRHLDAIRAKHPDLDQIPASDSWQQWIASQPPALQSAAHTGSTADVIFLLDKFKADTKPPEPRKPSKDIAVPSLRGQPARPETKSGKVPFSSIMHLPNSVLMQKYPDESVIDYTA